MSLIDNAFWLSGVGTTGSERMKRNARKSAMCVKRETLKALPTRTELLCAVPREPANKRAFGLAP